jgi:hypothetical protein
MNTVDLLKEFAKINNIENAKMYEFLRKYEYPKTIEELVNLPTDMLNHHRFFSRIDDPLQTFIRDKISKDRYETIDLKRVVSSLENYLCDYDSESDRVYAKEIENYLIKSKFGSIVYDW